MFKKKPLKHYDCSCHQFLFDFDTRKLSVAKQPSYLPPSCYWRASHTTQTKSPGCQERFANPGYELKYQRYVVSQ